MKSESHSNKTKERIHELFVQADENFSNNPKLSIRYVQLIRKLSSKYKIPLSKEQKFLFCKHCGAYLKRAENCSIRLHNGKIILSCKECGFVRRFVYK